MRRRTEMDGCLDGWMFRVREKRKAGGGTEGKRGGGLLTPQMVSF